MSGREGWARGTGAGQGGRPPQLAPGRQTGRQAGSSTGACSQAAQACRARKRGGVTRQRDQQRPATRPSPAALTADACLGSLPCCRQVQQQIIQQAALVSGTLAAPAGGGAAAGRDEGEAGMMAGAGARGGQGRAARGSDTRSSSCARQQVLGGLAGTLCTASGKRVGLDGWQGAAVPWQTGRQGHCWQGVPRGTLAQAQQHQGIHTSHERPATQRRRRPRGEAAPRGGPFLTVGYLLLCVL